MEEKERLDVLLTKKQLAETREKAKAYIMAGVVFVDGQKEDKPGLRVKVNANIEVKAKMPYVSRGGYKLEKAMKTFAVSLENKVCMDVGASTGGFTDCMLQNGAKEVFSVDVGYGQLAWKLRQNPLVHCMEKTNIRYVTKEQIPTPIAFSSIDVSFISLTKVLVPIQNLLEETADVVALIKPQFEAGREQVEKHGVVRKPKVHVSVIEKIWEYATSIGFSVLGLSFSPIKGPEGNIEYLIHLHKGENANSISTDSINEVVANAHEALS